MKDERIKNEEMNFLRKEPVMKKLIITTLAILSVFGLTACGNVEKNDKEVSTTTGASGVVTTTTTTVPAKEYDIDWTVTTTEGQTFGVTTSETTIYEEESTESKAVTTLPEGTQIILDSKTTDSEFIPVTTTTGERGYISTSTYTDIDEGYTTDHGSFETVHKGTTTTAPANTSAPTTTTVVATKPVTTTTVTTKAPTVVSSEKKTTTTSEAKKTTTTTKKKVTTTTTTKKNDTSSNKNKTQTMWANDMEFVIDYNNGNWGYANDLTLYYGDKVTAYPNDTVTINKNGTKVNYTKIKMIGNAGGSQTISIDGYIGYVPTSCLSKSEIKVEKVTEADVKKLCQELQEYSNSLESDTDNDKVFYDYLVNEYGSVENWYAHRAETKKPNNSSWHSYYQWNEYRKGYGATSIYATYDEMLKMLKEELDDEYDSFPDSHQVIYSEKTTNPYTGEPRWTIYFLY